MHIYNEVNAFYVLVQWVEMNVKWNWSYTFTISIIFGIQRHPLPPNFAHLSLFMHRIAFLQNMHLNGNSFESSWKDISLGTMIIITIIFIVTISTVVIFTIIILTFSTKSNEVLLWLWMPWHWVSVCTSASESSNCSETSQWYL